MGNGWPLIVASLALSLSHRLFYIQAFNPLYFPVQGQ
jgi:hypothetical protein